MHFLLHHFDIITTSEWFGEKSRQMISIIHIVIRNPICFVRYEFQWLSFDYNSHRTTVILHLWNSGEFSRFLGCSVLTTARCGFIHANNC